MPPTRSKLGRVPLLGTPSDGRPVFTDPGVLWPDCPELLPILARCPNCHRKVALRPLPGAPWGPGRWTWGISCRSLRCGYTLAVGASEREGAEAWNRAAAGTSMAVPQP